MKFFDFQRELEKFELVIFTLNDAIKIIEKSKDVVKSTLSRWSKEKKIFSLKKGYYSLKKIKSKFQLQAVYENTYIGLNSALEYYGSTTQRYINLELINCNILKNQTCCDYDIVFHNVSRKMFFGYEKILISNTFVNISNIEKTLIDCVYFSSKVYLSEIDAFIKKFKSEINLDLLQNYLLIIDSSSLNKRIGYLLEKNGILMDNLRIDNKYIPLNKNLKSNIKIDKKWKLIINEEF